jgi:hypothetical protein
MKLYVVFVIKWELDNDTLYGIYSSEELANTAIIQAKLVTDDEFYIRIANV